MKNMLRKVIWLTLMAAMLVGASLTVNAATRNAGNLTITEGRTRQVNFSNAAKGKKISWASGNKNIATVTQKGVIKGIRQGRTTVTAKIGKDTYKIGVSVRKNIYNARLTASAAAKVQRGNGMNFAVNKIYYKNNCMYVEGYLINRTGRYVGSILNPTLMISADGRWITDSGFYSSRVNMGNGRTLAHTFIFKGNTFQKGCDLAAVHYVNWLFRCNYR